MKECDFDPFALVVVGVPKAREVTEEDVKRKTPRPSDFAMESFLKMFRERLWARMEELVESRTLSLDFVWMDEAMFTNPTVIGVDWAAVDSMSGSSFQKLYPTRPKLDKVKFKPPNIDREQSNWKALRQHPTGMRKKR